MKEIIINNYKQQQLLSVDTRYLGISYLSEFEAKTGFFNASLYENNKVYLIAYLNALIHGLLKAVK